MSETAALSKILDERRRAMRLLARMATESTGWRSFFRRWYYSDEPLRNDAAGLLCDAGWVADLPPGTRLVEPPSHRMVRPGKISDQPR